MTATKIIATLTPIQTSATELPTTPIATLLSTVTETPLLVTPTRTLAAQPSATVGLAASITPLASTGEALQYVFPVRAKRVEYGRSHHDYPAADMFCPIGSDFVAPIDGIVDYVSREDVWNPKTDHPADRGGLSVAIVGDDGWRYYGSHLSTVAEGIEPGVRVQAGQLLGLTGASGNARGVTPHLHFGISHPTTPDDWEVRRGEIGPYRFLKAWEQGKMLTPSE
jgi:murein DD-endopeptidase MepM/ murein hydrolase activator NlpD